jgi:hypothetical protein
MIEIGDDRPILAVIIYFMSMARDLSLIYILKEGKNIEVIDPK